MQDPDPKCRHFVISWHFMAFWHVCQKANCIIKSAFSAFSCLFPRFRLFHWIRLLDFPALIYMVARDRFSSMYWPCISIILVDTLISNWIMWWKTENNNKRIPVVGALSGCSVLIWQDSQDVSSNFFSFKHSKPSLWLKGMPKVEDFKCKRWPRSTIRCGSVVRAFDCRTDDAWWQTLNFAAN